MIQIRVRRVLNCDRCILLAENVPARRMDWIYFLGMFASEDFLVRITHRKLSAFMEVIMPGTPKSGKMYCCCSRISEKGPLFSVSTHKLLIL